MRHIAIVGRGCVLPGALSPTALYALVQEGRDATSEVPADRWRLDPASVHCGPDEESTDRTWSLRGGYVRDEVRVAGLDHLDPMVHWAAFAAQQALDGVSLSGRGDVVLGNLSFPSSLHSAFAEGTWLAERASGVGLGDIAAENRFSSGLVAHHVASHLGLSGEAYCLDAACASSLYAIAQACDRLRDGLCDVAIAGAVNRADDLFIHIGFCALQAMSRTGQSRPFHRQADGLVPGEGAAVVALKRLDDALRDGDPVYGVIRGVGLSNDGRGKSLLAPAVEGQVAAMQRAYADAGWAPGDVDLVECHATGTPVGDATELDSTGRLFAHRSDVPIGSLKGNLGHLVTAAGAAGLIKVLEGMRHGMLPGTRLPADPTPALAHSPFRLVGGDESWVGRRRAAVSAFGFGGNNAHLLVEAFDEAAPIEASVPLTRTRLAITGLSVRHGDGQGVADFAEDVRQQRRRGPAREVAVALPGLRTPPRDLDDALPQQWWALQTAREATAGLDLPRERTAVWVGMGCDPEIGRYGARWRSPTWARTLGEDASWAAELADQLAPGLRSAAVVGTMPNIPANRVNAQLDLMGPSHTVSAEERSGLMALHLARTALAAGDIDAAMVGAVDLSCEPVHAAACAAVLPGRQHADAAVTLVLQRAEDVQPGQPVYGWLDDAPAAESPSFSAVAGHAHAASGLVELAAALVRAADAGTAQRVVHTDMAGRTSAITVHPGTHSLPNPTASGPFLRKPAHPEPVVMPHSSSVDLPSISSLPLPTMVAAPVLGKASAVAAVAAVAAVSRGEGSGVRGQGSEVVVETPLVEPVWLPRVAAAEGGGVSLVAASQQDGGALSALLATISSAHDAFVAQQTASHQEFLATQRSLLGALSGAGGVALTAPEVAWQAPVEAVSPPVATSPVAHPVQPVAAPAPNAAAPTAVVAKPVAPKPVAPKPAARPVPQPKQLAADYDHNHVYSTTTYPPAGLPTFDYDDLMVHARGDISRIFGPAFAAQDSRRVVVRMPAPPLLLADRVTGIDAEPASMGTGTLWTESDVAEDAWFLVDGRVPPGILIESGQADLMLISWLGVDLFIPEGRSYRLLGCELVFHGDAPRGGDTLRYDIHVDSHAAHGDVRLFFFHYDCNVGDRTVLTVRQGQAGFFTEQELADSKGVLWTPDEMELAEPPRLDPPRASTRAAFTSEQLTALTEGRAADCFGEGFDLTRTHTRTPKIPGGQLRFLDRITDFDPKGGPHGRGYLRGEQDITPDTWFFEGHFHNDPCMPGTLMLEACMQTMAFYLLGMGFSLRRDGWRFQPVAEQPYLLRCRGQVQPIAKKLVYEVFVDEVWEGDRPTLYADILCTVDGLKAFHCHRMGLELVPDWPMDEIAPPLLAAHHTDEPAASAKGHVFDYDSLLACAWGRPTRAFGPMYERFDSHRTVARLPGPPYHFMHRITELSGEMGAFQTGSSVVSAYDVPVTDVFFDDNGAQTLPMAVLMEAALQPCGWLASYLGSALLPEGDVMFRNLDGTATWHRELTPGCGTLRVRAEVTRLSQMGAMIIEAFKVEGTVDGELVFDMDTTFGFFPPEAFADQAGLPAAEPHRSLYDAEPNATLLPSDEVFAKPALATGPLMMLDRIDRWDPQGGAAGLGQLRSRKDIDAGEWCFKAHFFTDPVQPGSLGIEAFCQLLQAAMCLRGDADGISNPRFEPVALGVPLTWKYRGQVVPSNRLVSATLEVLSVERDDKGVLATAEAMLWVDGKPIYKATNLAMRAVPGDAEVVEPTGWVADHCPTWTVPAVPGLLVAERLLSAAGTGCLTSLQLRRWLPVPAPLCLTVGEHEGELALFGDGELAATATPGARPDAPAPLAALDAPEVPLGYAEGSLFHGPAFQLMTSLRRDQRGSSAVLDASRRSVPGRYHPALLDAATHGIPHDTMRLWFSELGDDVVCYPSRIENLCVWGEVPTGSVRVEARPDGMDGRFPRVRVQIVDGERVWCAFTLVEAPMPKGPIGTAPPEQRRAFLRDGAPGLRLSTEEQGSSRITLPELQRSDWLPGTVDRAFGVGGSAAERAVQVVAKEHIGSRLGIHPQQLDLAALDGSPVVVPRREPITAYPVTVATEGLQVSASSAGPRRRFLAPIEDFWDEWFGLGRWPVEDLYYGLIDQFIDRVVLHDPDGFDVIRGRSALYLGNHQVGVESLLFSIVLGGLSRVPTVTLAKMEHMDTWLGHLIRHCFSYPGVRDPKLITYFDRSDRASLPRIIGELAVEMMGPGRSVMVHVEGTRSLDCTTPVLKMSGAFLDMALKVNAPVVPVRFTGGLPRQPMDQRIEFPIGLGRQDIHIGSPILPEDLAKMPYGDRKKLVIDAMNALGPSHEREQPLPGDPALEADVANWLAEHDVSHEHAVLRRVLERVAEPSSEVASYLAGELPGGDWWAELKRRLDG